MGINHLGSTAEFGVDSRHNNYTGLHNLLLVVASSDSYLKMWEWVSVLLIKAICGLI